MTHPSAQTEVTRKVIEQFYNSGKSGDVAGLFSMLSEDVVVSEPPFLPYAGRYVGHDGFSKVIAYVMERLDLARMQVERLVVDGEYGFAVVSVPVHAGGSALLAEEWRVRAGKVVEVRIYFHDAGSMPLATR